MSTVSSVRMLCRIGPPVGGPSTTATFAPTVTGSSIYVPNSGRGQLEWLSMPVDPTSIPTIDLYRRPDSAWKTIETSRGVYNWTILDQALAAAAANGGRLAWRVMPMRDWSDGVTWPSYVPSLTGSSGTYPDWNSTAYVDGWCAMVRAMGAKYDADPRLYSVDLSGYAMFGEHLWDTASNGTAMTTANMQKIMEATRDAFPTTFVIMPAWGLGTPAQDLVIPVFGAGGKWGHRYDWLGGVSNAEIMDYSGNAWADQWKYGPVLGEWGENNGSGVVTMQAALTNLQKLHVSLVSSPRTTDVKYASLSTSDKALHDQIQRTAGFVLSLTELMITPGGMVTTTWSNDGVSPTYDDWRVEISIGGQVTALADNLKLTTPGTRQFTTNGASVTAGEVRVRVVHKDGYLPPMQLAQPGRGADGWYAIGSIGGA